MKKALYLFLTVALLLGAVSAGAMAMDGRPGFTGAGANGHRFLASLNLSAEQQQKLMTIRQDFQKDTLALRQDMQKKRLELRQLWKAQPLDQAAIDAKTREMTALRIQLVTKGQSMWDKTKSVLTPEQLKKITAMKDSRGRAQFGQRMKRQGQGQWGERFRGGCCFRNK